VAIDAEASVRGHHGHIVLLLRLHEGEDVDRPGVDRIAQPGGAGDAADEEMLEALFAEKLAGRRDGPPMPRRRADREHGADCKMMCAFPPPSHHFTTLGLRLLPASAVGSDDRFARRTRLAG